MKSLQAAIRRHGECLSDTVLKVDAFLNHQVDARLTLDIGREFARRFRSAPEGPVTKVLTIEASGIHFALATAAQLGVPFVYAKKSKAVTMTGGTYSATVNSFTRKETFTVSIAKRYLSASDRVIVVDDFLATGDALLGLRNIVLQSGATLIGVGAVIEKSFQDGRRRLEATGTLCYSLARISSMSPEGGIHFLEDEFPEGKELALEAKSPTHWWTSRRVSELKVPRPVTVAADSTVSQAIVILRAQGVSQLPVLAADGEILGAVALSPLSSAVINGAVSLAAPVTTALFTQANISGDTTLGAVSRIVERDPFAFVVDLVEGKTVVTGVVTRIDLLNYIVSNPGAGGFSPTPARTIAAVEVTSPSVSSSSSTSSITATTAPGVATAEPTLSVTPPGAPAPVAL